MRNDVQKPGGVPRSAKTNRIIPNSFRSLSGYLRTVTSGASSVASSVRSAGASVASSIADRIEDTTSDQVQWAGFDKLECEGDIIRQVLLLGYRSGFQVWDVEEAHNVRELVSRHDGPVSFLQMLPKPIASKRSQDKFADVRSLLVIVTNGSFPGGGNIPDGLSPSYNGTVANGLEQGNGNYAPSIVQFYSLSSQSYVHVLKFRSAVYSIRCSPRVVAISQAAQIHCFDAATLEMEYTLLTYPLVSNCLGSGGIGCGPLAVGPRWLAYSGSPVAVSNAGRVSPTPAASLSGSPVNGSLVAHYAKESSKQLAAGIVTLGDIGYKKLSRYCSELLPDGNNSLKSGSPPSWKTTTNGQLSDADNVGMVIVRDIVCKTVIAQFRAHRNPVSALRFDPSGTLLVTASVQGHIINVFRIMPSLSGSSSGSDSEEPYIHLYKLQRGFTNAVIQDISISDDSHWIMISSSRGTSHLFAINPAGGNVSPCIDGSVANSGLGFTSKSAVRWPSGATNFNQQSLCASGPPVTLSVVSRIRNGNSGWRGTVSGAAAAAAGRTSTLSGPTASAFHNCRANGIYGGDSNSLRTRYHLLLFSPSGSVIQYVLRSTSGPDCGPIVSGTTAFYDPAPDGDARFVVEALQKWDICQRRSRRDREDNSDVYGEYGSGDSNKIYPEEMRNAGANYPTAMSKTKTNSEERHHLYISEAELQMHQAQIPLWAKPEIYFQTMVVEGLETENVSGGETEIEKFPIHVIEARSKGLIPVYDYLKVHKLQQSRTISSDSNRSGSLQKSGLSEDGRLSCRSSCSSLGSCSEGAVLGDPQNYVRENGWDGLGQHLVEGFVNNNDNNKMEKEHKYVNSSERPKMENNLKFVNNNKGSLKMDTHFNDDGDELD